MQIVELACIAYDFCYFFSFLFSFPYWLQESLDIYIFVDGIKLTGVVHWLRCVSFLCKTFAFFVQLVGLEHCITAPVSIGRNLFLEGQDMAFSRSLTERRDSPRHHLLDRLSERGKVKFWTSS